MEQKIKFIFIGLIGIIVITAVFLFQAIGSKEAILRERDELKAENSSLASKAQKLENDLRDRQGRLDSMKADFDQLTKDKDELLKRLDVATKEKDKLVEQIKTQKAQAPEQMPQGVTSDAYWAGVLKAKTDLELQLGNVRNELRNIQISNEQLQREKAGVEMDLSNLKRDKEELQRQLDYNKKVMDGIAQELVRERNDKIQIQDSFKTIKNENALLTRQLKSLTNRKIDLEKRVQELRERKDTVERRVSEMETMLTDKISQMDQLKRQLDSIRSGAVSVDSSEKKNSVELPPIVVRPSSTPAPDRNNGTARGQIIAINRDNNFVIIDVGEESGVKVGDNFQVFRDSKRIADLEVIKISKSVSACDIKQESTPVKEEDIIR